MLLLPVLGQGTSNSNICVILHFSPYSRLPPGWWRWGWRGHHIMQQTEHKQETKMKLLEFVQTSNRSASQTIICIINMCLQSTYWWCIVIVIECVLTCINQADLESRMTSWWRGWLEWSEAGCRWMKLNIRIVVQYQNEKKWDYTMHLPYRSSSILKDALLRYTWGTQGFSSRLLDYHCNCLCWSIRWWWSRICFFGGWKVWMVTFRFRNIFIIFILFV